MFCKKCGKQVKDGAVFCTYCGTKIMPIGENSSEIEKKSLWFPIIIVVIFALIVACGIFFVVRLNNRADEKVVTDDIVKNDEIDKFDANENYSFETIEQDEEMDLIESDINSSEDTISDEVKVEINQYILPNSDSAYLSLSDLYGLSQEECRIARNELYARHGRKFDDEVLQDYFNSKEWYHGYVEPSDFNDSVLNEYEIANRNLIVQYEEEMGYR